MNDDILGQIYIAFGSGAWQLRVQREAVAAIRETCWDWIAKQVGTWDTEGVQCLERARATGRLAALMAVQRGDTHITADDVLAAFPLVRETSRTRNCP